NSTKEPRPIAPKNPARCKKEHSRIALKSADIRCKKISRAAQTSFRLQLDAARGLDAVQGLETDLLRFVDESFQVVRFSVLNAHSCVQRAPYALFPQVADAQPALAQVFGQGPVGQGRHPALAGYQLRNDGRQLGRA